MASGGGQSWSAKLAEITTAGTASPTSAGASAETIRSRWCDCAEGECRTLANCLFGIRPGDSYVLVAHPPEEGLP